MLSLPEGVEAENVKMQEELAVETKILKYGQEELAKGLATLFTMEQDMKTKQIKLDSLLQNNRILCNKKL